MLPCPSLRSFRSDLINVLFSFYENCRANHKSLTTSLHVRHVSVCVLRFSGRRGFSHQLCFSRPRVSPSLLDQKRVPRNSLTLFGFRKHSRSIIFVCELSDWHPIELRSCAMIMRVRNVCVNGIKQTHSGVCCLCV